MSPLSETLIGFNIITVMLSGLNVITVRNVVWFDIITVSIFFLVWTISLLEILAGFNVITTRNVIWF